ncbi:hypothetical protein JW899_03365 [Candidatus Uhrbacteria bacterium]|nr:hypothetical protein [Candidatus Uhrbacteria bacterium]
MQPNELPKINMDTAETGCCPKFDPAGWDGQEIVFDKRLFVKAHTRSFFHFPLNLGAMYRRVCGKIEREKAGLKDAFLVLSHDPSPWRGESYFAVGKDLPGEEMVRLSGTFRTKVFEGEFGEAGRFHREMAEYVRSLGLEPKRIYFFYTTCPKCAKHWGKNYMVAFAEV